MNFKIKCITKNIKGITKGKIYKVNSLKDDAGLLYIITDDNSEEHGYSTEFFELVKKSFKKEPNWTLKFRFCKFGFEFYKSFYLRKPVWKDKFNSPVCERIPYIHLKFSWFDFYIYKGIEELWERWLWIHNYNDGDEKKAMESWPWSIYVNKDILVNDWYYY